MMRTKAKVWFKRLGLSTLAFVFLLGAFVFMADVALADESKSLTIDGDGVSNPMTWTWEELQAMGQYQHVYSVINTMANKVWYVGEGVKLRELLSLAGIKEDARMLRFHSADTRTVTLTKNELLEAQRFCFPYYMDSGSKDEGRPGSSSSAGAEPVEPIIALKSAEKSVNPEQMNENDALFLMLGQRAVTEQTNSSFLKDVCRIEVLTKEPEKWDAPTASVDSGDVLAGTLIELSSRISNDDKIYYTTDGTTPTLSSAIYNLRAKRWLNNSAEENPNKPIEISQDTVIQAITIGPGKTDSEVAIFRYKIGTPEPEPEPGPPAEITLDESSFTLPIGDSRQLYATVKPRNAIDAEVSWRSDNPSVITVDGDGLVTVKRIGRAVVTAQTANGLTASCAVTGSNESNDERRGGAENGAGLNAHGRVGFTWPGVLIEDDKTVAANTEAAREDMLLPEEEGGQGEADTEAGSDDNDESVSELDSQEETLPADSQQAEVKGRYLIAIDAEMTDSADSGSMNAGFEDQGWLMDDEDLASEEYAGAQVYMWVVSGVLFFSGAGRRYRKYFKEEKP